MLAFSLIGSMPAAMRAPGLLRDAHNRIIKMLTVYGHAFGRGWQGGPTVCADAIMEEACEKLVTLIQVSATAEHARLEGRAPPSGQSTSSERGGMDRGMAEVAESRAPPCSVAGLGGPAGQSV